MDFLPLVHQLVLNFLGLLQFFIFLVVIFSWFPAQKNHPIVRFIYSIGSPAIGLAKKITPRLGMIDLSPLVAFFAIDLIRFLVNVFFAQI